MCTYVEIDFQLNDTEDAYNLVQREFHTFFFSFKKALSRQSGTTFERESTIMSKIDFSSMFVSSMCLNDADRHNNIFPRETQHTKKIQRERVEIDAFHKCEWCVHIGFVATSATIFVSTTTGLLFHINSLMRGGYIEMTCVIKI
jgi:hypothetical protein